MEKEKILSQMKNIVADLMTNFQTDFTKYDVPVLENAKPSDFPMIWQVGECHTYLLRVAETANNFGKSEYDIYDYVDSGLPFSYHFESINYKNDHYFLLMEDKLIEIDKNQCKEVVRDLMIPAIEKFKAEGGKLPKRCKVPVKFYSTTLEDLKSILKEDNEKLGGTLLPILKNFQKRKQVSSDQYINVYYDVKEKKFCWSEYYNGKWGIYGEIKFHGTPETGYLKADSVQIDPHYGWASHT